MLAIMMRIMMRIIIIMAKYSVDTDTMLKIMDDFWSYDDLLKSAENLIMAGCSK